MKTRSKKPAAKVAVRSQVRRMGTFQFKGKTIACRVVKFDRGMLQIAYRHPDGDMVSDAWIQAKQFTPDSRHCLVCSARVRNQNPKTITCSPACTARLHGRLPDELPITHCKHCGVATEDGVLVCDACYAQYTPTMLDDIGDDEP